LVIASHQPSIDFQQTARRVMREHGFDPDFGQPVEAQVASAKWPASTSGLKDLRDLLWSSIDNEESRDLDQVEVAEELPNGAIRILVAIADVDGLVAKGSPADLRARENSTSVYTGVAVFPMLPEEFSTDLSSLGQDADRAAVIIENVVETNGDVS
jgi:exoribonuclease-2